MVIKFDGEYFSVKDTLECGQTFRFIPLSDGKYKVFTKDKCAICYNEGDYAFIECNDSDGDYFFNYFDLNRDYSQISASALSENLPILTQAVNLGKGIRILNQDKEEMLFSFIISQNNNIPRIKKIINALCDSLGETKTYGEKSYKAFPTAKSLSGRDLNFYSALGLGYRASYILDTAKLLSDGLALSEFESLSTAELKKRLLSIRGIGPKVADCIALFGFHRTDSFPVDTWIEKLYREDFNGKITDRNKITKFFTDKFKENSGYVQQYLFHYKRNLQSQQK